MCDRVYGTNCWFHRKFDLGTNASEITTMKVALLVDVRYESVNEFNQKVEDLINHFEGRLIYRIVSRYPIRLLCAEDDKYPQPHVPSVPDTMGTRGQGVQNGKGWSQRRGLDFDHHRHYRSSDHPSGLDADVPRCIDGLRQCFDGPHRSGSRNDWTYSAFRSGTVTTRSGIARATEGKLIVERPAGGYNPEPFFPIP